MRRLEFVVFCAKSWWFLVTQSWGDPDLKWGERPAMALFLLTVMVTAAVNGPPKPGHAVILVGDPKDLDADITVSEKKLEGEDD